MSIVTEKNITSFLTADDIVFVGHLLQSDKLLKDRYEAVSKQYQDQYSFAVSVGARLPQSAIVCYNNPDDVQDTVQAEDLQTVESLQKFIAQCSSPLIPELTRRNEAQYATVRCSPPSNYHEEIVADIRQSGKSLLHYFFASEKEREQYVKEVRPIAKRYTEYITFATTDTNEYPEMLEMLGFDKSKPGGVLFLENPSSGEIFLYQGWKKVRGDVVDAFINEISEGKVKPWDRHKAAGQGVKHSEL